MKLLLIILLSLILVSATVLSHVDAKSKDSKAKAAIIKAIGKAVEGKYSTIKLIQLSKSNISGYILAYNKTGGVPIPTPIPPPIPPNPTPPPTGEVTKVCLIGDLKGSTVPNKMKDCNLKIGLGDLGYASDLSWFKSLNFNKCVVGNHDSTEDGSSSIYKEALAYCGDHWYTKTANGTTLIMGFNTNGDYSTQSKWVQDTLKPSIMANVKTIVLASHKGGHVPPNSHHPAEAKDLYASLEKLIPSGVRLVEVFGHNHVSSSASTKNWYQAGAGGKSFYSCGTDQIWTYCDNTKEQYLELTISNKDGTTAAKFIN